MHEDTHTGAFTTISAVAGGIGKVLVTRPLLLDVNPSGLVTVVTYAAASAVVGYYVKLGLDFFSKSLLKRISKGGDDE